jgi:hypothetical protein
LNANDVGIREEWSEATSIYVYKKKVSSLVGWLVGDQLVLRYFGPYGENV